MDKMEKLCKVVEQELEKIAEKGLTTANLETAYKLVDIYKDLKNTEYWETKGEYYDTFWAKCRAAILTTECMLWMRMSMLCVAESVTVWADMLAMTE